MSNNNFDVYMDLGSSKIRAAVFSKDNIENNFQIEKNCFSNFNKAKFDFSSIEKVIEKIILEIEDKSKEYLNNIDLMLDSNEVFSIGLSLSKNYAGLKLKKEDVQFLIQDAKQQVLRNYSDKDIIHIIIKNYKINNVDYDFLSTEINCKLLSLDIIFICLPKNITRELKELFVKFNVSVNQISLSSYAKSLNYKSNFLTNENTAFIDIGYNKTSIIYYKKKNISSFNVIPIGGNHITKDLSKILGVDLITAEKIKLSFDKDENIFNEKNFSVEFVQKIIFARVEEILELCSITINLNENIEKKEQFSMVLMGEGSKILDNKFREKILFSKEINLIEETSLTIFESAIKLSQGINKQEVLIIPKKQLKEGFFEKLFHFFS
jgi:cell division protein FtsA